MKIYNSFSGCRNDCALHEGDEILIFFKSSESTSPSHLPLDKHTTAVGERIMTHLAALC
jgi:hypothetical protein